MPKQQLEALKLQIEEKRVRETTEACHSSSFCRTPCKAQWAIACSPISSACSDPALPIHITSHCTESIMGSSTTSSTSCPRLSLKLPRNLNPSCDLSTIRQGSIF